MLDVAEHCFIQIAEIMLETNKSVRSIFSKYAIPEPFHDGSILELMSPVQFLEGVREMGLNTLSELEAACLLRVLSKPELENAIILNELVLIMENFGVIDNYEEDESEDDEDDEDAEEGSSKKASPDSKQEDKSPDRAASEEAGKTTEKKKKSKKIDFAKLDEKATKIMKKLARFLLLRYMHPREFFGPAIYKQLVKTKKKENYVDILQSKDFYLRLKLAGIRKSIKENESLNQFLCLDQKFSNLYQVKKMVKALEEVA